MNKFNIITHLTTFCNFDCTYCDVVKDRKSMDKKIQNQIIDFLQKNSSNIGRCKFFGGEPLIAFKDMKYIIDNTINDISKNYEIVTNTTLLHDEVGRYMNEYFSHIFFSIDSENAFDYSKVLAFIVGNNLEKRLYFNLVISPGKEEFAYSQFQKLYASGMRGFNILPVYFTQSWSKENLKALSEIMKHILELSLQDQSLRLYGFMENSGYDTSLANNTIFIDIDGKVYFSDMASTFSGKHIVDDLYIGELESLDLKRVGIDGFEKQKKAISLLEQKIYASVGGQRELHKIMDYFSKFLSEKNGK